MYSNKMHPIWNENFNIFYNTIEKISISSSFSAFMTNLHTRSALGRRWILTSNFKSATSIYPRMSFFRRWRQSQGSTLVLPYIMLVDSSVRPFENLMSYNQRKQRPISKISRLHMYPPHLYTHAKFQPDRLCLRLDMQKNCSDKLCFTLFFLSTPVSQSSVVGTQSIFLSDTFFESPMYGHDSLSIIFSKFFIVFKLEVKM